MHQPSDPSPDTDDRPPFGSWKRVYAVVIGSLLLVILLLIAFTRAFS